MSLDSTWIAWLGEHSMFQGDAATLLLAFVGA
ncbi:MAG: hypothetical protein JWO94_2787, partial [Verrucomicrobiaceae bacterium]|nr:hypothetical protein [Verrucomicrobiaceae bacterium]